MAKTMFIRKDGTLCPNDWRAIEKYQSYNIPILYISGSIAGMNKDNKVTLNYIFRDRSGTCTLKWQGASSIAMPKKNYTITFDEAFEVVPGWGVQKKYCLKANFVDPSHARNIVSAKLWGQVVKTRTPANAVLNALPNGGAIDGFPIIISLNGKFHGLYTFNIPKDGWMFGMTGTENQQAILCAEFNNNGATAFDGLATLTEDANGQLDFDLEYSSDDSSDWVLTSVNRLLAAVKDSDGTNITYGISPYLDWDSAIDYYIDAVLTANYDGQLRNYLLYTYDGVKWGFSVYDKDMTYGARATGKYFYGADTAVTFTSLAENHKLFKLIWKYMRPQLRTRFQTVISSIMSESNVANEFHNFSLGIPLPVLCDDARLWQKVPSGVANNVEQILNFYRLRLAFAQEWIKDTAGETELPEQVNPNEPEEPDTGYINQVPLSIGTDGAIYNGVGYKEDHRLSGSSGEEKAYTGVGITGFIPVSAGDVVRFKDAGEYGNLRWNEEGQASPGYNIVAYYDSSFTWLGSAAGNDSVYGICTANDHVSGTTDSGGICTFTVPNNSNITYLRMSVCSSSYGHSETAGLLVTVNQEIT